MSDKFLAYQKAIARILDSDGRISGTGFLVSENYLFTCAHVIIQALGLNQESFLETPQALISLDFPNYPTQLERKGIERKATVIIWKPCLEFFQSKLLNAQVGEDIALLELNEPLSCDELESISLTPVENPWDHEFRVYGFPNNYNLGLSTMGKLRTLQGRRWVQLKVDANEPPIEGGFSGAPLWDETVEGVIGMTVAAEKCDPQGNRAREVSFAIPASILQKIWLRQGRLIELLRP
ncbi:serine protease, partial [Tychonema sp. LEGE 07203]|nr:trypsin-like peptidase domain-containing protein [Tychonema sp. LEGE 07203]